MKGHISLNCKDSILKDICTQYLPTLLFNRNFAEASHPRKNVMEDYFAYLDFSKGGFWRKMCVYRTFLEERVLYLEYGKSHYSKMYVMFVPFRMIKRKLF